MYNKILVAMALDHGVSHKTLEVARLLLAPGGSIIALHVIEEPYGSANAKMREDLLARGAERAKALFEEKLANFKEAEPKLVMGHVSRTIVDYSVEHGVDCIVMGSHEPGLADYLLGSTAARVVRHAPCAVHVYRSA